jgi:hypothetical protein
MKNYTYVLLFILLSTSASLGQCEFPNSDFEDWTTQPVVLSDGGSGEVEGLVLSPDSIVPFLRLLFLTFASLGDPSVGQALLADPQGVIGFDQSIDASNGYFSIKLQAGYDIELADIYSFTPCTEVPETFSLDVKHVGNTNDTLTVALIVDKGLNGVPQDEDDLENYPAYVYESFVFDSDSAWSTIHLPIIENYEEDVDTAYYLIIAETFENSYFLIDNIRINEDLNPPIDGPTVILNEVQSANNSVEIYNYGTESVDVADLYLINDLEAETIGSNPITCPFQSTIIEPDDYLVVRIGNISNESGELVLSTSSDLNSGEDFLSYVSWGSPGMLEVSAVENNLWTAGEVAPDFFELGSLEYDGEGISSEDWIIAGANSLCNTNFTGCTLNSPEIEFSTDVVLCLCTDDSEYLSINYSGGGSEFILGVITNDQGQIIALSEDNNDFTQFYNVCSDEELTFYALSYDNQIIGADIGNNIADIVGCYVFSNPLPLASSNLQPFSLELALDGQSVANESFQICLMDDIMEIVSFITNTSEGELVYFVFNEFGYIEMQIESNASDLMDLGPGNYTIMAYNYQGTLYNSEGLSYVNIEGCIQPSDNSFDLLVQGPQDGCFTASEDISIIGLSLKSNLVSTTLEIGNLENKHYTYNIFNLSGSTLLSGNSFSAIELIDVSTFPSGLNIINITVDGQPYRMRFIKQ